VVDAPERGIAARAGSRCNADLGAGRRLIPADYFWRDFFARHDPKQGQQQQQVGSQQQQAAFPRARAACLEGRGYTVK
jgi:hypothetical protein